MVASLLFSKKGIFLYLLFFTLIDITYGKPTRSADSSMLANYNAQHEKLILSDTAFLNAIEPLLLSSPILANAAIAQPYLDKYKTLAFKTAKNTFYRAFYYRILGVREELRDRLGSCSYFLRKMYSEAIPTKDTFSILYYYGYTLANFIAEKAEARRTLIFFRDTVQPFTNNLIPNFTSLPGVQQKILHGIYIRAGIAYARLGDSTAAQQIIKQMGGITDAVCKKNALSKNLLTILCSRYAFLNFILARQQQNKQVAAYWMQKDLDCFGDSLTNMDEPLGNTAMDTYINAYKFYAYYLHDYTKGAACVNKMKRVLKNNFLPIYVSKSSEIGAVNTIFADLLAHQGRYQNAYKLLKESNTITDSGFKKLTYDRENILLGLTIADEVHAELEQTQAEKIHQQFVLLWLVIGVSVLAVGFVSTIIYLRGKQKNRLLQSKLDIARNLHDEIGPVMFYAKTLVKSIPVITKTDEGTIGRVEQEMQKAMELMRTISHDIKDVKNLDTTKLGAELRTMLQKIGTALELQTSFKMLGSSQSLGFNVYHHLRAIVGELITNSIKHAECTAIELQLNTTNGINLLYTDNGIGLSVNDNQQKGIGLANITERAAKMNASLFFDKPKNGQGLLVNLKMRI